MLRMLVVGVIFSMTNAQVAFAGGNESPTTDGALDCQMPIGSAASPPEYVTSIRGAVALQTSTSNRRALQTSRDRDAAASSQRYFAKSPLFVRTEGTSAAIRVARRARGHVALSWGNTDHDSIATREFTVGPCPGGGEWIVFPGGFYVDKPRCVELIVRASGRDQRVTIGVGSPCAGQLPPVQPSDT